VKTKLIAASLLFAVGSAFGASIGIGTEIGAPPPPRVVRVPNSPGAGYVWIDSYWYVVGHSWRWHDGYWTVSEPRP
jgi:hypothetical protein